VSAQARKERKAEAEKETQNDLSSRAKLKMQNAKSRFTNLCALCVLKFHEKKKRKERKGKKQMQNGKFKKSFFRFPVRVIRVIRG
jgi:hypothetical protein